MTYSFKNNTKSFKMAHTIDNVLPRSWDLGPPLPTGLQVSWPRLVVKGMPKVILHSGNKFNEFKSDFTYKVSHFRK